MVHWMLSSSPQLCLKIIFFMCCVLKTVQCLAYSLSTGLQEFCFVHIWLGPSDYYFTKINYEISADYYKIIPPSTKKHAVLQNNYSEKKYHLRESSAVSPSSSLFGKLWHNYLYCSLTTLLWKLEYHHPKEPGVIVAQRTLPLFLVLVHLYHLSFQCVSQICPSVRRWPQSASSQTCVRVCCEVS